MKYFLDTEFHEYKKQPTVCGVKVGKPIDTIELISIGIVSEDITEYKNYVPDAVSGKMSNEKKLFPCHSMEYYSICKDFDLKEAWNSYQLEVNKQYPLGPEYTKVYWLRDNVLKSIYKELHDKECLYSRQALYRANVYIKEPKFNFTYKNLKKLINKYGKTREQIAEEIKEFCTYNKGRGNYKGHLETDYSSTSRIISEPEFYGYYSDYDWIVFCWLFGRMIDLPKGFPMYCNDLKQELDKKAMTIYCNDGSLNSETSLEKRLQYLKVESKSKLIEPYIPVYPKQVNEHNALSDAKWNYELYKFLNKL